jgi:protein phosphatase
VIAAGGLGTWRYAQDSWYVGADGGHVALFRGVSQPVAGIRLSSLYQRTDLSLSAIPDASQVRATITASDLHEARQIVLRIRHDYQCRLARTAVSRWARQQAAASQRKGKQRKGKQRRSTRPRQGSTTKQRATTQQPGGGTPAQPASAARPPVPAFCPLIIGTGG